MPKIRLRSRARIRSGIRCPSQPLKSYNRSHMQLASSASIPDGFMAAMRLGGEKPHQGLPGRNPALYQGPSVCNSTTALGLQAAAVLNRIGSCSTGKERDTESGNDYFGARYYASSMGRFLSPDWSAKIEPIPYAKLNNPQSLNLYAYVGNNPLIRTDPDGHVTCSGSNDQCAQMQTAYNLAKAAQAKLPAGSAEAKAIGKVMAFYGKWGEKNGVNISFASLKAGELGTAAIGKDGKSVNITFDLKQINAAGSQSSSGGTSAFGERTGVFVHEGTHGVDERAWGHNPYAGKQDDLTEHNAYRNESNTFKGLGWTSASGLWYSGMTESQQNAAIDAGAKRSVDAADPE